MATCFSGAVKEIATGFNRLSKLPGCSDVISSWNGRNLSEQVTFDCSVVCLFTFSIYETQVFQGLTEFCVCFVFSLYSFATFNTDLPVFYRRDGMFWDSVFFNLRDRN